MKNSTTNNEPEIRIKVRGGEVLYIAYEIVNQLSYEYICYIDAINDEANSLGGNSVIYLPDDIRNVSLIGVNPFTFYCSKVLDGGFAYFDYADICFMKPKQRNVVLNNYDAVILDVNASMNVVHVI